MGSTNTVENAQPPTSDSTDVLRQLMEGISRQNERIEETNKLARQEFDRKKEKDDEKKDRMLKLHSYFINMLLSASSTYGDRAAKKITVAFCSFFNQKTSGLPNQQIVGTLQRIGFPRCRFCTWSCPRIS